MPLFHGHSTEMYALRGPSRAVKTLLQAAGIVKTCPDADAGWDRLVKGMVRMTKVDLDLASDAEAGIFSPGVRRTSLDANRDTLSVNVPGLPGTLDIYPDRSARGRVAVSISSEDDDAPFARVLATAVFFLPEEQFVVWHAFGEVQHVVSAELLLARYLLEASERQQPTIPGN